MDRATHRQALALAQPSLCDLFDGTGVNGTQGSAFRIDFLLAKDNRSPARPCVQNSLTMGGRMQQAERSPCPPCCSAQSGAYASLLSEVAANASGLAAHVLSQLSASSGRRWLHALCWPAKLAWQQACHPNGWSRCSSCAKRCKFTEGPVIAIVPDMHGHVRHMPTVDRAGRSQQTMPRCSCTRLRPI